MNFQDYVEIVPGKRRGKLCLKGTRIKISDVLGWLANGMTQQEIIEDFPELTSDHIFACLGYAAEREHRNLGLI